MRISKIAHDFNFLIYFYLFLIFCSCLVCKLNQKTTVKTIEVKRTTDSYAQFDIGSGVPGTIINWYCGNALLVRQSVHAFRAFGPTNLQELNPLLNTELTIIFYYV